jgi:hypothetical protein
MLPNSPKSNQATQNFHPLLPCDLHLKIVTFYYKKFSIGDIPSTHVTAVGKNVDVVRITQKMKETTTNSKWFD